MRRTRRPSSLLPLWLFMAALLLRAAMPFVAETSAERQGRALGEVCSVYGITAPPHGAPHPGAPAPAEHAGDDHCMLQALAMLGTSAPPTATVAALAVVAGRRFMAATAPPPRDAAAAWIARLKHGPPQVA